MAFPAGTQFGAYEILAPLGGGGMGRVYRARDRRLGRTVAIKLMSPEIAEDPQAVARLRHEAIFPGYGEQRHRESVAR